MNFKRSYGSTLRVESRRKLQSSNLGNGMSGGRTPGCGASGGEGSGVCAWSRLGRKRIRTNNSKANRNRIAKFHVLSTLAAKSRMSLHQQFRPPTPKPIFDHQ